MLSAARWSLRPSQLPFRIFATRNIHRQRPDPPQRKAPIPRQRLPPSLENFTPGQSQNVLPPSNKPAEANEAPKQLSNVEAVSSALAQTPDAENNLVTPVYMPEDPDGVLKETHPVMKLLDNSTLVIQRQLEMMNLLIGFEQANRYVIMDPHGNHIGYLAERDHGTGNAITRQILKTHRSFTTHVFDREEREVLRFHRPFSWISSRIRVYDAVGKDESAYTSSIALQGTKLENVDMQTSARVSNLALSHMRIIGSAEQEWALLRRKYNLFLARNIENASNAPQMTSGELPLSSSKELQVAEGDAREVGMLQFARVDEPFLSWDFSLMSEDDHLIGSVNRNFAGFGREIFTDTGVYALRMDSASTTTESADANALTRTLPAEASPGMTLDQRAVMLATAVSVDFDYFSRHSGGVGGMGMWPMWLPWGGGEAAGGVVVGEAGAVGATTGEAGIASEVGAAARSVGAGEGAIAGAGTMAGYEAMRTRANSQQNSVDDQSPQAPHAQDERQGGEDVWGQDNDPTGGNGNDDFWRGGGSIGGGGQGGESSGGSGGSGGGGDGGSGGGEGFDFGDWF